MLAVGRALVEKAAPGAATRFGYHLPPFNSVDHLHLHCFGLPFAPAWKAWKYETTLGVSLWWLPKAKLLQARPLLAVLLRGRALTACHIARTQRLGAPRGGASGGLYGALDDAA